MFHREFKWVKMCFMFLDTLNETNFHPPVRNSPSSMIIYMLYYDSDSSIIFKRKLLIRRFRKYIFGSLNRTESKDMIENINSLNCTSVFLDTSTIQKNTSIIQGLPWKKPFSAIFHFFHFSNIGRHKFLRA